MELKLRDLLGKRQFSFLQVWSNNKKNTLNTDKIMYANSVPDAWCVTKREIVQDQLL